MKCKECIHSNVCANNSIIETKYVKNELLICPDYEPAKLFYKMPFPEGTPGQIVIHAHWLWRTDFTGERECVCSSCRGELPYTFTGGTIDDPFIKKEYIEETDYCPHCGAKMDEE